LCGDRAVAADIFNEKEQRDYMIWATTEHYADFERQIINLNNGKELSDRSYKQRTEQVVNLVLASVGTFPAF
jgi:TetR/AcrR family transcriptional regulator